jgi:hypothetical protein
VGSSERVARTISAFVLDNLKYEHTEFTQFYSLMKNWFNIRVAFQEGRNIQPSQVDVPVFTAGQTVITFPVASALISVVYQVLSKAFPSWGRKAWVPVLLALLSGAAIYSQSASKSRTWSGKAAELFFAILNSLTLTAAALGIKEATD